MAGINNIVSYPSDIALMQDSHLCHHIALIFTDSIVSQSTTGSKYDIPWNNKLMYKKTRCIHNVSKSITKHQLFVVTTLYQGT